MSIMPAWSFACIGAELARRGNQKGEPEGGTCFTSGSKIGVHICPRLLMSGCYLVAVLYSYSLV